MSWGFKNYKAGLLMQSMPMSGIRLGEESDSTLSEFLKEQKLKNKKIKKNKKNWRLLKCRFEVLSYFYFWVPRHYCEKKKKKSCCAILNSDVPQVNGRLTLRGGWGLGIVLLSAYS